MGLTEAIAAAAERAFRQLFNEHPERFYYLTLVTTGEGHRPVISAWSVESLTREAAQYPEPELADLSLKWSYADSPYLDYGSEYFEEVERVLRTRPSIDELSRSAWEREHAERVEAMVEAMATLDSQGMFGTGGRRRECVVLVEVIPPDASNAGRALRLNSDGGPGLEAWLAEAAEPPL